MKSTPSRTVTGFAHMAGNLRNAASQAPLLPPEAHSTGTTPVSARNDASPTTMSSSPNHNGPLAEQILVPVHVGVHQPSALPLILLPESRVRSAPPSPQRTRRSPEPRWATRSASRALRSAPAETMPPSPSLRNVRPNSMLAAAEAARAQRRNRRAALGNLAVLLHRLAVERLRIIRKQRRRHRKIRGHFLYKAQILGRNHSGKQIHVAVRSVAPASASCSTTARTASWKPSMCVPL